MTPTSSDAGPPAWLAAGTAWATDVGPFYDTAGAQAALDGVSKQAVSQRLTAGRLLGLRLAPDGTSRERLVYPVWQFVPTVLRHLPAVLAAAGFDPERPTTGWTIATWLTSPHPAFAERSPLETAARRSRRPGGRRCRRRRPRPRRPARRRPAASGPSVSHPGRTTAPP